MSDAWNEDGEIPTQMSLVRMCGKRRGGRSETKAGKEEEEEEEEEEEGQDERMRGLETCVEENIE